MARTILTTLTLAMALGTLGCGEELTLDVSSRQTAIVNGALDSGHVAVGILHSGNAAACTATLIGKRTVLTAAHCVTTENPPYTLLSPIHFYVGGFYGSKYVASAVSVHPGYAGGNVSDLAVVRLAQDVSNVQPAMIASQSPAVGETVELVGYGKTGEDEGEFGTKRRAQNSIGKVQAQIFTMYGASGAKGNLCNGDSGGPTFALRSGVELLIGIHSTKGGVCGQEGNDMRVDAFYGWIAGQAQGDLWTGGPKDQAAPQVSILSPTHGAQVDASFEVQVSASDDVAVTQVVLYIDGNKAGAKTAAPYTFQLQHLTVGTHSLEAVAFDAAGRTGSAALQVTVKASAPATPPAPGPTTPLPELAGFGAACERSEQCAGGICALDNATGARFCTQACDPSASACPGQSACIPVGQTAVCGPSAPAASAEDGSLSGGCQLAAGGAELGGLLPLALLALLALARRRSR